MKFAQTDCLGGETGEVFTLPHVVDYMIREARSCGRFPRLLGLQILEPSCGEGAFVLPLVDALIAEKPKWDDPAVVRFLTACDISEKNIEVTKAAVRERLLRADCPQRTINHLLSCWFLCVDFLLYDFKTTFDLVVGNPPYIRFDSLSPEQQRLYRSRYETFSERCDIYVPFFERGLSLLSERGVFSFICANRFVRSSYGRKLRAFISANYHVALYLNLEHADPFVEKVSAYPAIYLIDRKRKHGTWAGTIDDASEETLATVTSSSPRNRLSRFDRWYAGDEPWTTTDARERIEADLVARTFPTIEKSASGTALGIGVATGADEIFLDPQNSAEIEPECLLPLVTSTEIREGVIMWNRRYMLNPYDQKDDKVLFELDRFPKAAAYVRRHAATLKARYCARQHPDSWYRTLDRIKYSVWRRPKIFLPDIQLGGNIALDEKGEFYPHHNVYWITSDTWNLKALCVILRSSFVTDQIRRVSVQMRGGSIRYQAQNLRHVHVPAWESLDACDVKSLESVFAVKDIARIDAVVHQVLARVRGRQRPQFRQGELFADVTQQNPSKGVQRTPVPRQALGGSLLLTGGTGFFGKSILAALVSGRIPWPRRLTILSRDPAAFRAANPIFASLPFVDWLAGDIRSFTFPKARYDAILHAATSAVTTLSDEEQTSVIREGMRHVIACARACGNPAVLLTSSGAVYGPQIAPVDETAVCSPVTAYGRSKLAAEQMLLDSGLDAKIARCFAFTGPYLRRDIHYAIGNFIRDALARRPIVVNGDGTPLRSYLLADDLVDWLWAILEKGAPGCVYNVGSDRAVSIRELAETVRRVLGSPAPVVVKGTPVNGVPPAVYVPCVERARRDLGLSVSVDLEEAILRSVVAGKGKE